MSLPPIFQYLPFLRGWRRRLVSKFWFDLPTVSRGSPPYEILSIEPPCYVCGFWILTDSPYLHVGIGYGPDMSTWFFCTCPKMLRSYGAVSWGGMDVYLMRYDDNARRYAMYFTPTIPVPVSDRVNLYVCLPDTYYDIENMEIRNVPDSTARIIHLGMVTIDIVDVGEFLQSIWSLWERTYLKREVSALAYTVLR